MYQDDTRWPQDPGPQHPTSGPASTVPPPPAPGQIPPPPTGAPLPPGPGTRQTASGWAIALMIVAGIVLILPSAEGLLLEPDRFAPLVFVRFAVAGVVALAAWAIVRPRRQNVFMTTFAIACILLAGAVFAAN